MDGKADGARAARRWTPIALAAIMLTGSITAEIAAAAEGTAAPAAAGTEDAVTSASAGGGTGGGSGSSAGSGSKSLKLKSEDTSPSKSFFFGKRKATYRYSIAGTKSRNLKIQAVDKSTWKVAHTWKRSKVTPGKVHTISWAGTGRHRRSAPAGTYVFRVRTRHGANANRRHVKGGDRSFAMYPYKFPVRSRHAYGDGYGAPRAGHVHQGQDVLAPCGKRLVAARGGRVQYSGYQASGAGYYLVIDGKATGHDYVYMHLRRGGRVKQGQRVRTGERIGTVGETGDASGCHLHFEMWTKPGWYEGGKAMPSVTRHLKFWDRWS
ncbi:MAG: M23 family metallopeptidase [Solirubrobacterales bacterium]